MHHFVNVYNIPILNIKWHIMYNQFLFRRINQSDWSIHIKLNFYLTQLIDKICNATKDKKQYIQLLLKFKSILDLDCHNNIVFWAACLTGFYGVLRPSNFLVKGSFDPDFNLRRVDVMPCSLGMLVTLKVTKTLQFRSKPIEIVLPMLHGHPLCPNDALCRVLAKPGYTNGKIY
jgi:hypothetical protein